MFTATCPPGLEDLLESELIALGATATKRAMGAVLFGGPMQAALKACLHARVPSRILWTLGRFPATDRTSLYDGVRALDWVDILAPHGSLGVTCSRGEGALDHTHFVALVVKDGIVDNLREATGERPNIDPTNPDARIHVHIRRGEATIAFDLSGESLHRRGYRQGGGDAPLKENVAAAMLLRSGWPKAAGLGQILVDPMCGGATLLIEAAWMALDRPPNAYRQRFGAEGLRHFDQTLWQRLRAEAYAQAEAGAKKPSPWQLWGSDNVGRQLGVAQQQIDRAGVTAYITLTQADVADLMPPQGHTAGMVVTNPPYGERIGGSDAAVQSLMGTLGVCLKRFAGFTAHVLVADPQMGFALGLRAHRTHALANGPIPCTLLHLQIPDPKAQAAAGDATHERVAMLVNRLRKNMRKLAPYLKTHRITAYRLYDADLPEYAVAIDVYQGTDGQVRAHVAEYAPPATIAPATAQARLRDVLAAVGEVLVIGPSAIALKVRRRQVVGTQQYGAHEARTHRGAKTAPEDGRHAFWVEEDHLAFLVDLHTYLDTGLFLDHRRVRAWMRTAARGKHVLNLFAYTGSVSVAAAAGGAHSTTTVDMSHTYLAWAEENLRQNRLWERNHQLVQADCLGWLEQVRSPAYDIAFVNPPTFSNSKRMQGMFDVVADHGALIQATMRCVVPSGVALFTTHAKRLKLDPSLHEKYTVTEMTASFKPKDFDRPSSGCRAWLFAHRAQA
jgi:23S rRNA (guanine2445-N2)-methyltransferase / 23S rRNA (guanine2069-N7)-methyltransferase